MKRKVAFLIAIVIVSALVMTFFACGGKNNVPVPASLQVEEEIFSWGNVKGASGYEVVIDGVKSISVATAYCDLSEYVSDYELHNVKVRAVEGGKKSAFSREVEFQFTKPTVRLDRIAAPTSLSMSSYRLSWVGVVGNCGYYIYFGQEPVITVPKNTTYYDFTFTKDGTFIIQLQTIGDGITYANSSLSAKYSVTVKDGQAQLAPLAAVSIYFDAETRTIRWANTLAEDVAEYLVYLEGQPEPLCTIKADSRKAVMSYAPGLTAYEAATFYVQARCVNGMYSSSAPSNRISFPMVAVMPQSVKVGVAGAGVGESIAITWQGSSYNDGYSVEVDGYTYSAVNGCTFVPPALADGMHYARVRAVGKNSFYVNSAFSEEIAFNVKNGAIVPIKLATPTGVSVGQNGNLFAATCDSVANADYYMLTVVDVSGGAEYVFKGESNTFTIAEGKLNGAVVSGDTLTAVNAAYAALDSGAVVRFEAASNSPLYVPSNKSKETLVEGYRESIKVLDTPSGFSFGASGVSWGAVKGANGYAVNCDGQIFEVTQTVFGTEFSAGVHKIKVSALGSDTLGASPYSEEYEFVTPMMLAAPTDLAVVSGLLSWKEVTGASGYDVYMNGALLAVIENLTARLSLSKYVETDGEYTFFVVAKGNGNFADSCKSAECVYVKTDGTVGTEAKPFEVARASEFVSLVAANPQGHFKIVAASLDFAGEGVDASPLNRVAFSGGIEGEGSTFCGLKLTAPLFGYISGCTIKNMTLQIEVDAELTEDNSYGVIAANALNVLFENVNLKVSGRVNSTANLTFGGYVAEGDNMTATRCGFEGDISVGAIELAAGCFAAKFSGNLNQCTLTGNVEFNAVNLVAGGAFAAGSGGITVCENNASFKVNASDFALLAGFAADNISEQQITLSDVTSNALWQVAAGDVTFGGISAAEAVIGKATSGGKMTAECSGNATVSGVITNLDNVAEDITSNIIISVKAQPSSEVKAAGVCIATGEKLAGVNAAFGGEITLEGGAVQAGGIAVKSSGPCSVEVSGKITVKDAVNAMVAGAVYDASDVCGTVQCVLDVSAENAYVGGVCGNVDGKVDACGKTVITVTDCTLCNVGGIAAEANALELALNGFETVIEVTVAPASQETAAVGGIAAYVAELCGGEITLNATLKVNSSNLIAGGFIADLGSEKTAALEGVVNLDITSDGTVGGAIGRCADLLTDVAVYGSLKMLGGGTVGGVCGSADTARNLTAEIGLDCSGKSVVGGVCGVCNTLENASLKNCVIKCGGECVLGGLAGEVNVAVKGGDVLAETVLCGNDKITFGGIAGRGKGSAENCTVGRRDKMQKINLGVLCTYGTLFGENTGNVQVIGGEYYADCSVECAGVVAGGLLGIAGSEYAVNATGANVTFNVTVTAADVILGGVCGTAGGSLQGVSATVNFALGAGCVAGGVAGRFEGGNISGCFANGTIKNSGKSGGLAAVVSDATVTSCYSLVNLENTVNAGGLFCEITASKIKDCYAALSTSGSGVCVSAERCDFASVWYSGKAECYGFASEVSDCTSDKCFVDMCVTAPQVKIGDITVQCKSLSYGFTEPLGSAWSVSKNRYPLLVDISGQNAAFSALPATLIAGVVQFDTECDLYDDAIGLPKFYGKNYAGITWVDEGGLLDISDGVITPLFSGEGVLCGYLSGGVKLYEKHYTVSGNEDGTEDCPYVIAGIKQFARLQQLALQKSGAYFELRFDAEAGDEIDMQDYVWNICFNADAPFDGVIDMGGYQLCNLTVPAAGLFGNIGGGTVKNLVLKDCAVQGAVIAANATSATFENITVTNAVASDNRVALVGASEGCAYKDIMYDVMCEGCASAAVIETSQNDNIINLSAEFAVCDFAAVDVAVFNSISGGTVSLAQCYVEVGVPCNANCAFAALSTGTSFADAMFICDASSAGEASVSVCFAGECVECNLTRCATLFDCGKNAIATAMSADGAATCEDCVSVAAFGMQMQVAEVSGVTVLSAGQFNASCPSTYKPGAIFTPLGTDVFERLVCGETPALRYLGEEVADLEITGGTPVEISTSFALVGATLGGVYEVSSDNSDVAYIEDGFLKFGGNGTCRVTFKDICGNAVSVTVTVSEYAGFAAGDGSAENPYLITAFADLEKMKYYEGVTFRVDGEISGTLTEPLSLNGTLEGAGKVQITLACDQVFESLCGTLSGVSFDICLPQNMSFENEVCGIVADSVSSLELINAAFEFSDVNISLESGVSKFGFIFGEAEGQVSFDGVEVNVNHAEITVCGNACAGVVGVYDGGTLCDFVAVVDMKVTALAHAEVGAFARIASSYIGDADAVAAGINVTANYTLCGNVTAGGFAAVCNGNVEDVVATVTAEAEGTDIVFGGVVGDMYGSIKNVHSEVTLSATAGSCCLGGVTGRGNGCELSRQSVVCTFDITANGAVAAGGVVGADELGTATQCDVQAQIDVDATLAEDDISAASDMMQNGVCAVVSAGGLAGKIANVNTVKVTATKVTVSVLCDCATEGMLAASGGVAGVLDNVTETQVIAEVTCSGLNAVCGGVAGVLFGSADYAVVTVVADGETAGGVCGVFGFGDNSVIALSRVDCTLTGTLCGAVCGKINRYFVDESIACGVVSDCVYCGDYPVTASGETGGISNNEKCPAAALYGSERYTNLTNHFTGETEVCFFAENWVFNETEMPKLNIRMESEL